MWYDRAMTGETLIFGGSFDPVHIGHLLIARHVAERVGAGRVLLVPTGHNPLKNPPVASDTDRLAMLREAIRGEAPFDVSEVELHRPPPHYTIETIEELRGAGLAGPVGLLLGADLIGDLPKWHRVEALLERVTLRIACRPPFSVEQMGTRLEEVNRKLPASSRLEPSQSLIKTPHVDISSTDIRNRLNSGLSVRYMTPDPVVEYIGQRNPYSN